MKKLQDYIIESSGPVVNINSLYRVNIGKENDYYYDREHIGDVIQLTKRHYSDSNKTYTFSKPRGNSWTWAMDIDPKYLQSEAEFQKYLDSLNKDNEFYQYFQIKDKDKADKLAKKSETDFKNQKWDINSVLKAIKAYKPLNDLKYDYKITNTYQNKNSANKTESIYISSYWRILVINNEIILENMHNDSYKIPNMQSLYKVLAADENNDASSVETIRQMYSY